MPTTRVISHESSGSSRTSAVVAAPYLGETLPLHRRTSCYVVHAISAHVCMTQRVSTSSTPHVIHLPRARVQTNVGAVPRRSVVRVGPCLSERVACPVDPARGGRADVHGV